MRLCQVISLLYFTNMNSMFVNSKLDLPWLTLPVTPSLPEPISSTTQTINGVKLWYQEYNKATDKIPIVLNHGGLGHSAYFGEVIKNLIEKDHYVIAIDSRGHGRSTFNDEDVFTYDLFAKDMHDLLESIGVEKYNVVGWSDGAATTLSALQNPIFESKIHKAFVFAGFMVPEDTNSNFENTKIYEQFVTRCAKEYHNIQPKKDFHLFAQKVGRLESELPNFTQEGLGKIDGSKVAIVGAEHDEAVSLDVPAKLNSAISGSKLIVLDGVSHFAPLQEPETFTKSVLEWVA